MQCEIEICLKIILIKFNQCQEIPECFPDWCQICIACIENKCFVPSIRIDKTLYHRGISQDLYSFIMEGQIFNPKKTVLIDEDLLDHVYDPPLWSGGPYLKMVDEDVNFCYSPVSDPLLRTRLSSDDTGSESLTEFKQMHECRINLTNTHTNIITSSNHNRLSRKTMYFISTCLAISGLLFFLTVCL